MTLRFMQAGLLLVLAACGAAPSRSAAQRSAERPFTVTEVANFDTPWAMDFLPGSGVPLTNMALLTEKEGKLWLVDVGTGQQAAGRRRSGGPGRRAGRAWRCRRPSRISPATSASI